MPFRLSRSAPSTMTQSFISKLTGKAAGLFGRSSGLTDTTTSISPTALLENFIPGYGPIHKFLLVTFGIDVTVIVSLGAVLWLADRTAHFLWGKIDYFIEKYCTSEIYVSSSDEIFDHLEAFFISLRQTQALLRIQAKTKTTSTWEADSETIEVEDGKIYYNFSEQEAKTQPDFIPGPGKHRFWHNNIRYTLDNKENISPASAGSRRAPRIADRVLSLSCRGWSTGPIKNFLAYAKDHYYRGRHTKTIIKTPGSPHDLYMGNQWRKAAERPRRSLSTVLLDDNVLKGLLRDINDYLSPDTREWYTKRGIPYRRGYLFYGPPGTGKSSLIHALAGHFGLVIHLFNLHSHEMTEEELGALFLALPARCIVLLEDIDTAGLVRDDLKSDGAGKVNESEDNNRISLSSLLNIIDGR